MRPLNVLGSVAALLVVVALAAACSSSAASGSSGSGATSSPPSTTTSGPGTTGPAPSPRPSAAACESTKVRDLHTDGTIAQSVVQAPANTKLLGVAVDHAYVVWTEQQPGKLPVVCQASLASRRVTGLWRGPVASAPATTEAGVFFVTTDGTLWQVDHNGHRARPIAQKVWHGVAYDPATGMIAYTDRADPAHNRITVLRTHPGKSTVYRRFLFPTCTGTLCTVVRSVAISKLGVAWTQRPTTGSAQGLVSRRAFTDQGSATHAIPRTPAPTLVPGFGTFAFSVKDGYDLWPLPAKHVTKAPKLTGQTLIAVGDKQFYTLHTTPQGVLLQAVSATGTPRVLDNLSVLQASGQTAQAGSAAIGPTRICEAVNVYPSSALAGAAPVTAYVRCALVPRPS